MPLPHSSTVTRTVTVNGTEYSAQVTTFENGRSMIDGPVTFRENGQLVIGPRVGSASFANLQEADDAIREIGLALARNKTAQPATPARVPMVWLLVLIAAASAAAYYFLR